MDFVATLLDSALVHNVVLVYFLGLCPALGVSNKRDGALGMGLATTLVLSVAVTLGWTIDQFLLAPLGLEFLRILTFIVVIAAVVQLLELVLKAYVPTLHKQLGVYLPLITTNCAVLGAALLNSQHARSFSQSFAVGLGSGIGFLGVMIVFSNLRERLTRADVPQAFAGTPIAFVTAGVLSLALMGFDGLGAN